MPSLRLTSQEYIWLHDSLRATLSSRRVLEDPEMTVPVNIFTKLSRGLSSAYCKQCWKPEVYANGRCEACDKAKRRKAS